MTRREELEALAARVEALEAKWLEAKKRHAAAATGTYERQTNRQKERYYRLKLEALRALAQEQPA